MLRHKDKTKTPSSPNPLLPRLTFTPSFPTFYLFPPTSGVGRETRMILVGRDLRDLLVPTPLWNGRLQSVLKSLSATPSFSHFFPCSNIRYLPQDSPSLTAPACVLSMGYSPSGMDCSSVGPPGAAVHDRKLPPLQRCAL